MSAAVVISAMTGIYVYKAVTNKLSTLSEQVSTVGEKVHVVSKDVEIAKHQVKNDHGTNLRDDLDAVRDRLDLILAEQARQGEKQREMTKAISDGMEEHSQLRTHLEGVRTEMRHERERVDNILLAHTGVLPVVRAAKRGG
jgi:hypothetical protein|nr:MAG TPA: Protein of unknown function (DUF2746) [Caudoviricetes sp.]